MNGTFAKRRYQSFRASPRLQKIVEAIWIQESPPFPDTRPTTVVPTGRIELIFHYGDPYVQHFQDRRDAMAMCHVVGQQKQPIVLNASGNTGIAIVRFTPWGAYALLGELLAEITNQIVDLELLWPRNALSVLQQRLFEAPNHDARARCVEAFVAGRLLETDLDSLTAASVDVINRGWGRQRVADIATNFELGRRQFTRRFTRKIGASPKQLSCVLRAQKAILCVRSGIETHDIVERCGYADQAHFVRDVSQHTGLSPTALAELHESAAHRYFNSNKLEQFCATTYL